LILLSINPILKGGKYMIKKMGMTLVVVGAITLAGCGAVSSSTPGSTSDTTTSEVDPALAKLQSAFDSLGGLIADPTNITTGFQVPISLANGVTATWTSAEPGVLSFSTTPVNGLINATVNRPVKGNGDASFNIFADLSIAAELTAGNLTRRWTQGVTVKQSTVDLIVINSIADILALKDPALDRALNVTLSNMTIFARSGGEAFAFDGTGIIQIYRGAAENLTVGKVYTISGLIDWYFGIWEIVDSTAEEQVNATPQMPTKEPITGVLGKVNRLTGEGAHLSAGLTAAAGNFEPIYARVTGKVAIIADRPANYNTYILDKDMEPASFVAGTASVPANALLVYYQTVNYDLIKAYNGLEISIDVVIYTFRSDQRAFAVYYVGGPTGITANLTDAQAQTIDAAALSLPPSITDATTLTLPATGTNGGSAITWSSSHPDVINATTGAVTIPDPAVVVTLTASIQKGSATAITRTFEVVVGELENTILADFENLTASSVAYSEAIIVWKNPNNRAAIVADATGFAYIFESAATPTVTSLEVGQFVGLNYVVGVFNGFSQMTNVKVVTPKGATAPTPLAPTVWTASEANLYATSAKAGVRYVTFEGVYGYQSGNFTNGYLPGFGLRQIQLTGSDNALRNTKFNVTGWLNGRSGGVGSNPNAVPPFSTIVLQGQTYSTPETVSDAEKLALATQRYVAPVANPTLTSNLTLPTPIYGTVAWTSENTSVISNSGVITRPASGQPDVSVKLTYVITVGAVSSQPVEITYVVKAQEAVTANSIYKLNMSASSNIATGTFNTTYADVDTVSFKDNDLNKTNDWKFRGVNPNNFSVPGIRFGGKAADPKLNAANVSISGGSLTNLPSAISDTSKLTAIYVQSTSVITGDVNQIKIVTLDIFGTASNYILSKFYVQASSSADFSTGVVDLGSGDIAANSTITINSSQTTTDSYYRVFVGIEIPTTTSNGGIIIQSIEFIKA
jgi:hypothetical protein